MPCETLRFASRNEGFVFAPFFSLVEVRSETAPPVSPCQRRLGRRSEMAPQAFEKARFGLANGAPLPRAPGYRASRGAGESGQHVPGTARRRTRAFRPPSAGVRLR